MAKERNEQIRSIAHAVYLKQWPGIEIAQLCGVSEQTISKWVTDGGWKAERIKLLSDKVTAFEMLTYVYNRTVEFMYDDVIASEKEGTIRLPDSGIVDKLSKLHKQVETKEIDWEQAIDILRRFGNHVSTVDPRLMDQLTPILHDYMVRLKEVLN